MNDSVSKAVAPIAKSYSLILGAFSGVLILAGCALLFLLTAPLRQAADDAFRNAAFARADFVSGRIQLAEARLEPLPGVPPNLETLPRDGSLPALLSGAREVEVGTTYFLVPLGQRPAIEWSRGDAGTSFRPVALAALNAELVAARLKPQQLTSTGSSRVILVAITGTPWHLLAAADKQSFVAQALTSSRWTTITILVFIVAAIIAILAFRRDFLNPAMALLQRAHAADPIAPVPKVHKLWQPWMDLLESGRLASLQHTVALAEQNRLRDAILFSAIDAIVTSNEDGVITDFNPAAEAMFGWSRTEIVGQMMEATIVPPEFRHAHRTGMHRHKSDAQKRIVRSGLELQGYHRDGNRFPIELAIAEASIDNTRLFIGYIRDLTDRHRSEAELLHSREALYQSEKLASLGSLLAGVAHELNNPLAIVVGRAAMLEEKLDGSPLLPSVQKLRAAADRCNRIVKTFLAMARQSGPRRGRVQLNDLVEGALDMSAYALRSDGVTVCLELDPDLPTTSADGDQLIQVMINLIVNAQHAMAPLQREHQLTIRTCRAKRGKSVILEIADTGPGVPEALVARVFEPFFTTKDVGSGTGMGLSVSKGMIEAHDGQLTLHRNGPGGATFRIALPLIAGAELPAPVPTPHAADQPSIKARILIVDDEAELLELLAECLAPLGVDCDTAADGVEALRMVSAKHYDAVLTDVRMPGMDGITLYERLKIEQPTLAARLAFISGDVLQTDPTRLAAIGNRPIIEKPFDPPFVRDVALTLLRAGDTA